MTDLDQGVPFYLNSPLIWPKQQQSLFARFSDALFVKGEVIMNV